MHLILHLTPPDMHPAKSKIDSRKRDVSDLLPTFATWYNQINWLNTSVVVILPIVGLILAIYTPLQRATAVCSIVYYFITGLGITAGRDFPFT